MAGGHRCPDREGLRSIPPRAPCGRPHAGCALRACVLDCLVPDRPTLQRRPRRRSPCRRRRGRRRRRRPSRRRTGRRRPRRPAPAVAASMPPSTSIARLADRPRKRWRPCPGEPSMKAWPPQPGLTVMQRTMSASPRSSATASTGVPGLIATPARQPSSRIAARVRLACGVASCVEGDRVGAGLGEGLDLALGRLDHQVDVDRPAGRVDLVGDRASRPAARS